MEYKIENGQIAKGENGNPVVVVDGKEIEINAIEQYNKVRDLSAENAKRRVENKDITTQFEEHKTKFSPLGDDLEKALQALETVKGLDSKALIDSKTANEERQLIEKDLKQKMQTLQDEHTQKLQGLELSVKEKEDMIFSMKVSQKFSGASALKGTVFETMPDVAISEFGKNFRVEDGHVVGYLNGQQLLSKDPSDMEQLGKPAKFDDALNQMIDNHPRKDSIRKAGTGGLNGSSPGSPDSKKGLSDLRGMSQADYNKNRKDILNVTK